MHWLEIFTGLCQETPNACFSPRVHFNVFLALPRIKFFPKLHMQLALLL